MKKRIALAAALLLCLGTAVASTLMYAQDSSAASAPAYGSTGAEVTADTMAMWKANALATDYVAPKVPI